MPGDRTTWGSFEMLAERSLYTQKQIVEAAAAMTAATGTHKLIGDLYATGMDEAAIEAAGLTPSSRCWPRSTRWPRRPTCPPTCAMPPARAA